MQDLRISSSDIYGKLQRPRIESKIDSKFDRSDHIHFWITRPKDNEDETMGHFYVSSSGVAWVEKNCNNPETRSWAELDKWMAG